MAYTSYKQFAPNGYEFIDDKTGQSVVASGPEAILHARKIDSIYAPVDPMMRQAAQADRLAFNMDEVNPSDAKSIPADLSFSKGFQKVQEWIGGPEEKKDPLPLVPNYGQVDAPPPMIAREPDGDMSPEEAEETLSKKRAATDMALGKKLEGKAGVAKKIAPPLTTKQSSSKRIVPDPNDWNMEREGSQFLTEPTTDEEIADKAYIANEVAAAASPPLPGPVEQLGPSVPVSRTGIMGPSPVALDEWMKADQALALQQAEAESKGLDRQAIIDQRLSNIADVAEKSSAKQIELLQQEESSRAETRAILDDLRKEFNASINPKNAFNKPSFGDKVEAGLFSFIGGLGSAFLGVSPDKIVEDMRKSINKDAQRRGEISKRIEEAYKNSDMLAAMADKDKAIIATQGALQTQAILSRIDALKAANLTEAQRDRLALVRPGVEAMHAKFLMDLDTQRNGTVNYALAGGMKPKGGGGGEGGDKALENLLKYQNSKLANTYIMQGKAFELPPIAEGAAQKLRDRINAYNLATNALNKLREIQNSGEKLQTRSGLTAQGLAARKLVAQIVRGIDAGDGQGQSNEGTLKSAQEELFTNGIDAVVGSYTNPLQVGMANLAQELKSYGGREVERLWQKRLIGYMTPKVELTASQRVLSLVPSMIRV